MKRRMRKIWMAIPVLIVAAALAAGCGPTANQENLTTTTLAQQLTVIPATQQTSDNLGIVRWNMSNLEGSRIVGVDEMNEALVVISLQTKPVTLEASIRVRQGDQENEAAFDSTGAVTKMELTDSDSTLLAAFNSDATDHARSLAPAEVAPGSGAAGPPGTGESVTVTTQPLMKSPVPPCKLMADQIHEKCWGAITSFGVTGTTCAVCAGAIVATPLTAGAAGGAAITSCIGCAALLLTQVQNGANQNQLCHDYLQNFAGQCGHEFGTCDNDHGQAPNKLYHSGEGYCFAGNAPGWHECTDYGWRYNPDANGAHACDGTACSPRGGCHPVGCDNDHGQAPNASYNYGQGYCFRGSGAEGWHECTTDGWKYLADKDLIHHCACSNDHGQAPAASYWVGQGYCYGDPSAPGWHQCTSSGWAYLPNANSCGSTGRTPCAGMPNGTYCWWNLRSNTGLTDHAYQCTSQSVTQDHGCGGNGCNDGRCNGPPTWNPCGGASNGLFCGGSRQLGFTGGDTTVLYDCEASKIANTETCGGPGCKIELQGADHCNACPGPRCGNLCCSAGDVCFAGHCCNGTERRPGCPAP